MELAELSREQLLELARKSMDRLWSPTPPLDESIDGDGNLVRRGTCAHSGRPFALIAILDDDEDAAAYFGDIGLQVALDNRVASVELVHEEEPGDKAYLAQVSGELYVIETEDETRGQVLAIVNRLGPELASRALDVLTRFEHYSLDIDSTSIRVELAALDWDEEDWSDAAFDIEDEVESIARIAAIFEANLPDTFTVCAHCQGRFNAASSDTCTHCGAPAS